MNSPPLNLSKKNRKKKKKKTKSSSGANVEDKVGCIACNSVQCVCEYQYSVILSVIKWLYTL